MRTIMSCFVTSIITLSLNSWASGPREVVEQAYRASAAGDVPALRSAMTGAEFLERYGNAAGIALLRSDLATVKKLNGLEKTHRPELDQPAPEGSGWAGVRVYDVLVKGKTPGGQTVALRSVQASCLWDWVTHTSSAGGAWDEYRESCRVSSFGG
jgi:hypothetical protein